MFQIVSAIWVLHIEIDREQVLILIIFQNIVNTYPPRMFIFNTCAPPFNQRRKFLELHRACLGIVLHAFGERMLIEPDISCRLGTSEEKQISLDTRIRREDSVWQADNRMQVKVPQQLLLDARRNAVAD